MSVEADRQLRQERNAGLLLIAAAAIAVIAGNGPFAPIYQELLHLKFGPAMPRVGQMELHHWIADGLMAIFFLFVGLEVKREWYDGRLSTPADRRLPILAAAAGMAVPALSTWPLWAMTPNCATDGPFPPPLILPLQSACWRFWDGGSPLRSNCCW